jgi:lysophospholipase L1-like esterase
MKKEWLLTVASVTLTLIVTLGLIRWFAPQLLGGSPDLQLVQIDKKVPPFFDNVFRAEDYHSADYLIKDPIVGVRAVPLYPDTNGMGPNDLMGFRNSSIPNSAKIVVLGDSQSYGNNAVMAQNWPSLMAAELQSKGATLYNMSVGGWSAPQYLNMFSKANAFQPEVVIVALYTGNDPLEGFLQVYGNPYWRALIPNKTLSANDAPKVSFPTPKEKMWSVQFKDGVKTVFTPTLRLSSNLDHPAVRAGYKIMEEVVRIISEAVKNEKLKVFVTIVPTKELVYASKVEAESIMAPPDYRNLVARERTNLQQLAQHIGSFPSVTYVDILKPLQQSAMQAIALYPENENGHPVAAGYAVIGHTLAGAVGPFVSTPRRELVSLETAPGEFQYLLLKENGFYVFASPEVIENNGWPPGIVKTISEAELKGLPLIGRIIGTDPFSYGPLAAANH